MSEDSYGPGCANCVSEGEVIYSEGSVMQDSSGAFPAPADAGSSTRDEGMGMESAMPAAPSSAEPPSAAPDPTPADAGGLGDENMFDDPPAPAPDTGDADMFDDGGTDDSSDDLDDLFPAAVQMRIWTDDTGTFSTRGQLVELHESSVRLLKENGRHCTVPFHRLSAADFQLVQRVAAARGLAIPFKVAQR